MNLKRGFEKVTGYDYVNLPTRKTSCSAGYDIESAQTVTINAGEMRAIQTGLKAYMPINQYLAVYIRSSLAIKHGIVLMNGTGIIDSDYYNNAENEGHIMIALWNTSKEPFEIKKGDRIAQGIFHKYFKTDDDKAAGERLGGIGSTGR